MDFLLTVSHNACISVLNHAEQRRPAHEIVQVESEVIILGQSVEIGQVQ